MGTFHTAFAVMLMGAGGAFHGCLVGAALYMGDLATLFCRLAVLVAGHFLGSSNKAAAFVTDMAAFRLRFFRKRSHRQAVQQHTGQQNDTQNFLFHLDSLLFLGSSG